MIKSQEPLVSVIVASYNYEKYIAKTLDGLVSQTYKNLEIIVVDDGSSDNSVQIIQQYVKKYPNIHLYCHEGNVNRGLSQTLQLGLRHCRGEWVAFCESDDYYMPTNIAEKIALAKHNLSLDLIVNGLQWQGGTVWDLRYTEWTYKILRKKKKNVFKYFTPNLLIITFSSVLMKKSVLMECDFNTPVAPWLDFWLWRQVAFNHTMALVDKPLTVFLRHPTSYIAREKAEKLEKNRPAFIRASDRLLRGRHGRAFLWHRYAPYIIGRTEDCDWITYRFLGIPVFAIKNEFLFTKIKYKYLLLKFIPLLIVKKYIRPNNSIEWGFKHA